jgi:hypothetical protein
MQLLAAGRRLPLAAAVVCAVVAWCLAAPVTATRLTADDRSERTFTLAPGQSLGVAITAGSVRVTGAAGRRDVRVEIARHAPSAAALTRVPVVVTDTAEGPRLAVTQIAGGADPALRTDLVVTAPLDVVLEPITVAEGRVDLRGLRGRVRATVARGPIVAEDVGGILRLETTIGSVEVTRAVLDARGLLRLRAFNGDVRLGLAAPPRDTRVMALALNGTVTSAVPLTMKDGWGPRWGEATLGRPDRVVSIDVVTGAIRIEAPAAR